MLSASPSWLSCTYFLAEEFTLLWAIATHLKIPNVSELFPVGMSHTESADAGWWRRMPLAAHVGVWRGQWHIWLLQRASHRSLALVSYVADWALGLGSVAIEILIEFDQFLRTDEQIIQMNICDARDQSRPRIVVLGIDHTGRMRTYDYLSAPPTGWDAPWGKGMRGDMWDAPGGGTSAVGCDEDCIYNIYVYMYILYMYIYYIHIYVYIIYIYVWYMNYTHTLAKHTCRHMYIYIYNTYTCICKVCRYKQQEWSDL